MREIEELEQDETDDDEDQTDGYMNDDVMRRLYAHYPQRSGARERIRDRVPRAHELPGVRPGLYRSMARDFDEGE